MLEFNPPVHGTWNIVHIGMLMPECHQIYVCALNCMRGVVLTAAEMGASDRFSYVLLKEKDILNGTVEEVTIEGTIDVIRRLPQRPKAVALFTVCTHQFLGCDLPRIYAKVREALPDIDVIEAYMDPINQKEGPTPDQKLRRAMHRVLRSQKVDINKCALIGSNVPVSPSSELSRLLKEAGMTLAETPNCPSYEEFVRMGEAAFFLSVVPNGRQAARETAERLGRPHLHLPMSFDLDEIGAELLSLTQLLKALGRKGLGDGEVRSFLSEERQKAERALAEALDIVGERPIAIDYTVHPRPVGLALCLLGAGFRVERLYLNAVSSEEEEVFVKLMSTENPPEILTVNHPGDRIAQREGRETLAIGQQAAWREGTVHFVNMVEGGSLHGFWGIREMARLMQEAVLTEKDPEDLLPRKGLGCDCCL